MKTPIHVYQEQTYITNRQKMDTISDEWSKLSLVVANDPNNFENWETLVAFSSKGLSKVSDSQTLERFRITNDQFLLKFPFVEQYWINYAQNEFRLGFTERSRAVFEQALNVVPFSYLIWMSYLHLLQEVELSYNGLMSYYRRAEVKIGYHYHSFEFWKSFLEQEVAFNGKSMYYFNLLKKTLAIPTFNYSYFFKLFFQELDSLNSDTLHKMVNNTDLQNKLKLKIEDTNSLKKIDFHDVRSKIKKIFTDSYITTQFRVFEQHQFEKSIGLEYHVPTVYRSYQELANWEKYLCYMEVHGSFGQVEQLYHRALIPLANYPQFWIKFADFYLANNDIPNTKQILSKSLLFVSKTNAVTIQAKILKLEVSLKNFIKARDIAQLLLDNCIDTSSEIIWEILLEYVKLEHALNSNNQEKFRDFILNLIQNSLSVECSLTLITSLRSMTKECTSNLVQDLNKSGRFTKESKYWVNLLEILRLEGADRSRLISVYEEALSSSGPTDDLSIWYNLRLSYYTASNEGESQKRFTQLALGLLK